MARPSFLEQLRNGLLEQFNGTLTKQFLIKHQAEFPAKIRAAITDAKEQQEENFMYEIYNAVRQLFMGREMYGPWANYTFDTSNQNWYGLDSSVDKESEVEALIHCFRWISNERFKGSVQRGGRHRGWVEASPMHMLLSRKEALSFMPLFVKMDTAMSYRRVLEKLFFPELEVFSDMFGEAFVSNSRIFDDHAVMQEYSNEILSIFSRLIEQDILVKMQIRTLVQGVFSTDFPFVVIEPVFRKFINWYPSALYGLFQRLLRLRSNDNLVATFITDHRYRWNKSNIQNIKVFETFLDLGMIHFPEQLGFAFHSAFPFHKRQSNFAFPTTFHMMMEWGSAKGWSSEKILKIIHDKLFNNRGDRKILQSLVVDAASNDDISLDGLYELIRFNPTECLRH